eukprot:15471873-Alexandrium_andersonii.AAC.1
MLSWRAEEKMQVDSMSTRVVLGTTQRAPGGAAMGGKPRHGTRENWAGARVVLGTITEGP